MKKLLIQNLKLIAVLLLLIFNGSLHAKKGSSFYKPSKSYNNYAKKSSYVKKSLYEGLGKRSKVNGLPKYKITSGHGKRTSSGYKYVNPYARSK